MQQIETEVVYNIDGKVFTTINAVVEFSESKLYDWVNAIESVNIITASQRLAIVEALVKDKNKVMKMLQLVDEAHALKNNS